MPQNRPEQDFAPVLKGKLLYKETEPSFADIYEAKQNPELVVKEFPDNPPEDVEEDLKFLKKSFGEFLPKAWLVIAGQNEQSAQAYVVSEKVKPAGLDKDNMQRFCRQLDDLIERAVEIFLSHPVEDALAKKSKFPVGVGPDINQRNLVFGTTRSNQDPKLYCVDLFPVLHLNTPELKQKLSELVASYRDSYAFPKTQNSMQKIINFENHVN